MEGKVDLPLLLFLVEELFDVLQFACIAQIVGSQCFREVSDVGGLEGCELTFHEAEISWRKTDAAENNPLTQCESYETSVQNRKHVLKFVYSVGNQVCMSHVYHGCFSDIP